MDLLEEKLAASYAMNCFLAIGYGLRAQLNPAIYWSPQVAKMAVNALCIACLVDETRSLESKVGLESNHRRHPGFVLNSSVREAS